MSKKIHHAIFRAWLAGVFACFIGSIYSGAQERNIKTASFLDRPAKIQLHEVSFDHVLADLRARYKLSFVADGEPALKSADVEAEGTLRQVLDKVARAFDYAWSLGQGRFILMHKRFHRPDEYPQASLPELREAAADVVNVLVAIPMEPGENWEAPLRALGQSLTPEQMGVLRNGGRLKAAALNPAQRTLMERAVNTNAFASTFEAWKQLYSLLEVLPQSRLEVRPNPNARRETPKPVNPFALFLVYPGVGGRDAEMWFYDVTTTSREEVKP